jgi:hypothetical protein
MKSMSRTRKAIGLKLPNGCPHRSSGVRLPSQIAKISGPRSSASPIVPPALAEEFLVSTIALRSHQDKTYPGALVASLSIPWGDSGNERGGYHLVWAARSGRDRRRLAVARRRAGGTRYLAVSDRDAKAGHSLALKLVLAAPVSAATVDETYTCHPHPAEPSDNQLISLRFLIWNVSCAGGSVHGPSRRPDCPAIRGMPAKSK